MSKYYILIDENRKIITRQIEGIHKISENAIEVTKKVFETSIQESHNYLNEDLTTCTKDVRTAEEIAEEEILAKLPTAEELEKAKIELVALDLIMSMKEGGIL